MTMEAPVECYASLQFLSRDPLYDVEKPYSIRYYPHGDIPQTNLRHEPVERIPMQDIRPTMDSLSLNDDGFIVCQLDSEMTRDDYEDPNKVSSIYVPQILDLLIRELKTNNISILEYLVRRRHSSFPQSNGSNFEFAQPVPAAHIDFSPDCVREIIEDRYADRTDGIRKHHHQILNIWKPLRGPLRDWPLAFCLPSSIDHDNDLQPCDGVYSTNIEESIQLHYSPRQRWYFLKDQMPNEVLIFRTSDSILGMKGGVPHCSFEIPNSDTTTELRESIEIRALVCYTNGEPDLDMERVVPSNRHGPSQTIALPTRNRH